MPGLTAKQKAKAREYTRLVVKRNRRIARAITTKAARSKSIVKTEAKKAAAAAALAVLESKYFHCNTDNSVGVTALANQTAAASTKEVTALGFSTLVHQVPNHQTNYYEYPVGQEIKELHMARVFGDTETDPFYKQYQLDGTNCTPVSAHTTWKIQRVPCFPQGIGDLKGSLCAYNEALQANFANALPIRIRVVRVTEKTGPGVQYVNNPNSDLFLNQFGKEYGVDVVGFSSRDAEACKVNTRRYTVLTDTQFTLAPGATYNFQSTGAASVTSDFAGNQLAVGDTAINCEKTLKMSHQLTVKKGGKLHYNDPNGATMENPSTGHRREYIFFHAWFLGMGPVNGNYFNDRTGGDVPASWNAPAGAKFPVRGPQGQIWVGCTPVSTFKDT